MYRFLIVIKKANGNYSARVGINERLILSSKFGSINETVRL
jgi:hypothetical protein